MCHFLNMDMGWYLAQSKQNITWICLNFGKGYIHNQGKLNQTSK